MKKFALGFLAFLSILIGLSLHYYLPDTTEVKLVGTEVKRADGSMTKNRDVRFIIASDMETGKTLMYRNEDMGWPPHFKFDSGDLSGEAMNLKENQPNATILLTHYGWRIPIFSLYPNATKLKPIAVDYEHMPWFNLIFLVLFIPFLLFSYWKAWKWVRRASDKIEERL